MSLAVSPSLTPTGRSDAGTDAAARALQALVQMAANADAPLEALVKAVAANNLTTLMVKGETLQLRLSVALPVNTALLISSALDNSAALNVQVKPAVTIAQMAPEAPTQAASAAVVSALASATAQTDGDAPPIRAAVLPAQVSQPERVSSTGVRADSPVTGQFATLAPRPVLAAGTGAPLAPALSAATQARQASTPAPAQPASVAAPVEIAATAPSPVPDTAVETQRPQGPPTATAAPTALPDAAEPAVAPARGMIAAPPAQPSAAGPIVPAGQQPLPTAPSALPMPLAAPQAAVQPGSSGPAPAAPSATVATVATQPQLNPSPGAPTQPGPTPSAPGAAAPPAVPPSAAPASSAQQLPVDSLRPVTIPYASAPRPSATPQTSPAISAMPELARAVATQQPLAPMLADAVKLAADPAMPQPLRAAAQQVVAQALDPGRAPLDAATIRQAVENAGVLRPLTPLATPDLAARLTALRNVLTSLLSEDAVALPTDRRRSAPLPLRGDAPHGARSEMVPNTDEPALGLAHRLLTEADGALSRLKLLQAASQPADGRPADPARPAEYRVEVPMLLGREATSIQFVFDREAQPQEQKKPRGWRMRFALNVAALGEVGADISILGTATQVTVWASETETAALIEAMLPDLGPALAARGLEPGAIRMRHGQPGSVAAGRLLDSAR